MSIFVVETYVVKTEKKAEFTQLLNEFLNYKQEHAQLFDGLKSWKLFKQNFGAIAGMYIEVLEFENMADREKISQRIFEDEGMKKISTAFHLLLEPATFSANIWSPVA